MKKYDLMNQVNARGTFLWLVEHQISNSRAYLYNVIEYLKLKASSTIPSQEQEPAYIELVASVELEPEMVPQQRGLHYGQVWHELLCGRNERGV